MIDKEVNGYQWRTMNEKINLQDISFDKFKRLVKEAFACPACGEELSIIFNMRFSEILSTEFHCKKCKYVEKEKDSKTID